MEAQVPGCAQCGAPLPIEPTAARVSCDHCGQAHRIDDALRARMLAYVGGYARAAREELRARWVALFYENNRKATVPFVVGSVGVAIAVVLWIGLVVMGRASVVLLGGSVVATLFVLRSMGLGFRQVFAMGSPEDLARFAVVRCAACGACSAFPAGQPASACSYCAGTRLVPSRVADAAVERARSEAHAAHREEASAWHRAVAAGDRLVMPMVVLTLLAVLVGAPALIVIELLWLRDVLPLPSALGLVPVGLAVAVECTLGVRSLMRTSAARRELEARIAALVDAP